MGIMWKILGEEAIYIDIPETWKRRMVAFAGNGEKEDLFRKIVGESKVEYMMNGETEEHTFFIRLSDDVTPEQIQALADVALDILKKSEFPCISVEDVVQRYQVIITNYHEPEIIGLNKTPGMSSGAVFMPIIQGLSSPGRMNENTDKSNLWRSGRAQAFSIHASTLTSALSPRYTPRKRPMVENLWVLNGPMVSSVIPFLTPAADWSSFATTTSTGLSECILT